MVGESAIISAVLRDNVHRLIQEVPSLREHLPGLSDGKANTGSRLIHPNSEPMCARGYIARYGDSYRIHNDLLRNPSGGRELSLSRNMIPLGDKSLIPVDQMREYCIAGAHLSQALPIEGQADLTFVLYCITREIVS
jgi:hypothetical protein